MLILCTHHKGGVGKTELALHAAGALCAQLARVLLVDCDSQASAWEFHVGKSPDVENEPRAVDDRLSVIWNPGRRRIKSLADLEETYDHFVIDIDSPLENSVQTIVQNDPDLVLIPVNLQPEALTRLPDPLTIIAALEATAAQQPRVRIVPLGAKLADVRAAFASVEKKPKDCRIAPRVRELLKETHRARKERRYIWKYSGCEDLAEYYSALVEPEV
ncbi:MAG: AAA family ATPase [Gemmataceae bacterium]|nr:AAA family ATPase [Gemmataceae bacterium]